MPADPALGLPVLFRSATLLVKAGLGRRVDVCFVVFDSVVEDPSRLDRTAFGEHFFASYGIDAIHILSARNDWYQAEDLPAALAVVQNVTRGYPRVVTYGSSMGGYAALRFASSVGAQAAIAISPQYSMLAAVVPFETRWSRERRLVAWRHEKPGDRLAAIDEAIVFYDACGLDRDHAEAIRRDLPGARLVPMRHAGHPAGAMLADVGLLASMVVESAVAMPDAATLLAAIRAQRHRSGQYLFTLARRQPPWRLRLKARLAQRATEVDAPDAHYLSYLGLVDEALGEDDRALALHRQATQRPGAGQAEFRLAEALCRAGAMAEAGEVATRARALLPALSEPIELDAAMRALLGAPAEALQLFSTSPRFARRRDLVALLRLAARLPLWRTGVGRALGRRVAQAHLARGVLRPDHPLTQLALADAWA